MCKTVGYRVRLHSHDASEYISVVDSDDERDIEVISISSDDESNVASPPIRRDVFFGWNTDDDGNENNNNGVLVTTNTVHTADDRNQNGFLDYLHLSENNGFEYNGSEIADDNRYFLDDAERAWLDAQNNNNINDFAMNDGDNANGNHRFPDVMERAWLDAQNDDEINDGLAMDDDNDVDENHHFFDGIERVDNNINDGRDDEENDEEYGESNGEVNIVEFEELDEFERILIGYYVGKYGVNINDDDRREIDWVYSFVLDEEQMTNTNYFSFKNLKKKRKEN